MKIKNKSRHQPRLDHNINGNSPKRTVSLQSIACNLILSEMFCKNNYKFVHHVETYESVVVAVVVVGIDLEIIPGDE